MGAGFGGAIAAGIVALLASLFVLGWGQLAEAPCRESYSRCHVDVFYPKLPKAPRMPPVTISPLPPSARAMLQCASLDQPASSVAEPPGSLLDSRPRHRRLSLGCQLGPWSG